MVGIDFYIYCFDEVGLYPVRNKLLRPCRVLPRFTRTRPIWERTTFKPIPDSLPVKATKWGSVRSKVGSFHAIPCSVLASLPVIMLIIVGTCVGVMVILILITILYRQKYMWSEKLNKFKTSQSGRSGEKEEDVYEKIKLCHKFYSASTTGNCHGRSWLLRMKGLVMELMDRYLKGNSSVHRQESKSFTGQR